MEKLRATQQFLTPLTLKMLSINDIQFPKMKSRLNLQEVKLFKNEKSASLKQQDESLQGHDQLVRSYSMSLLTIKKDLKSTYFPKKKRLNLNPENIICIKGQKGQNFASSSKNIQSMKLTLFPIQKHNSDIPINHQINIQNHLTQQPCQKQMRNSGYPGVKFESIQFTEKRTQFLKKFLPGLQNLPNDGNLTARLPKKKHLFNSKTIISKKHKQELPDELVTRKLVWEGKEMKKVNHNSIYQNIIQKSRNQKNQKLFQENHNGLQDKFIEFMRLSAWEFHDDLNQARDPQIKTSRH